MKFKIKKIVIYLTICGVVTSPFAVSASQLDTALSGMFSNLTGPGPARTPDRTAFVGGGLEMRTPIANINLVTFDPPRISAGCGGLDMFGGSFSFINAAQLVALFRKVAANAIGLAFKAAIDAINPQLGKLMTEFQNLIKDANNVAKNSCALAQIAVNYVSPSKESIDSAAEPINAALLSARGIVSDWDQALKDFTAVGPAGSQQASSPFDLTFGNGVWNMINAKNLAAMLTDPTSMTSASGSKDANEILMSITGMAVNQIKDGGVDPSGAKLVNSGTGDYLAVLDVVDLLNGGTAAAPLRKFKCDTPYDLSNQSCLNPTVVDFQFVGMKGYVRSILLGFNNDGVSTGLSLVDALATDVGPTAQQTILLQTTQVPVQAFLTNLGSNQAAQRQTLFYLSDVIANGMLITYLNAVTKVTSELLNNPTSPVKEQIKERITYLKKQSTALYLAQASEINKINDVQLFVDTARKGNIAMFYTANKAGN